MIRRLLFLLALAVPFPAFAAPSAAELSDFFLPPEVNAPRLSPDGAYLAYIAREGDRYSLGIYDFSSRQKKLISDPNIWPMQVWWKTPRRLLAKTTNYRLDGIGYSAMDPDGGHLEGLFRLLDQGGFMYDSLPDEPRKVLMLSGRELKKVDIDSGISTTVDDNVGGIDTWVIDRSGRARAGLRSNGVFDLLSLWWRPPGGDWHSREFKTGETRFLAQGVDRDEHYLWGWQTGVGTDIALARFDTLSGKFEPRVFVEDREPTLLMFAGPGKNGRPFAAAYPQNGLMQLFALDDSDRRIVTMLQQRFEGYNVSVLDATADQKTWLMWISNSRTPGAYVLFNTESGASSLFSRAYSAKLAPERLAAAEPVSFQARGGQTLSGLLWRPKDASRPPLVVICPGALPTEPVTDAYQANVQALAAQGFAVLAVNVRGTVGFGHVDREAIEGKWAITIREDLEDAVATLAQRQLIDPARVALYGERFSSVFAIKVAAESRRFAAVAVLNPPKAIYRDDLLAFSNENGLNSLIAKLGGWSDTGKLANELSPIRNIAEVTIPALYLCDEDSWRGRAAGDGPSIWAAAKKSKVPGQTGLAFPWSDKPVLPVQRSLNNAEISLKVARFFMESFPHKS